MNMMWKIGTLAVGAVAGIAAKKAVDLVWEKGLGKRKPTGDDADLDQPFAQIVAFTAVSAIVTTVVAEAVKRQSAKAYGKHAVKVAEPYQVAQA